MNDIIMGYIIPGIIALAAAFGVFKVVKNKLAEVRSFKDLVNFFLSDETVLHILNNIISDMELDVKHYDRFEDFLLEYKTKVIANFKEYLKSKNIPDGILNLITEENIEKIIDAIISKTTIMDELDKIFQKSIESGLDDDDLIEEVDDDGEPDTDGVEEEDEDTEDEKKEETTDINLNSFYEE